MRGVNRPGVSCFQYTRLSVVLRSKAKVQHGVDVTKFGSVRAGAPVLNAQC
jgi:hypothetical protein